MPYRPCPCGGAGEERRPLLAPTQRNSKREMLLGEQWRALTKAEKAQYRVEEEPQVDPHAQATSLAPWPLSHGLNPALPAPSATPPFHAPAPLKKCPLQSQALAAGARSGHFDVDPATGFCSRVDYS